MTDSARFARRTRSHGMRLAFFQLHQEGCDSASREAFARNGQFPASSKCRMLQMSRLLRGLFLKLIRSTAYSEDIVEDPLHPLKCLPRCLVFDFVTDRN